MSSPPPRGEPTGSTSSPTSPTLVTPLRQLLRTAGPEPQSRGFQLRRTSGSHRRQSGPKEVLSLGTDSGLSGTDLYVSHNCTRIALRGRSGVDGTRQGKGPSVAPDGCGVVGPPRPLTPVGTETPGVSGRGRPPDSLDQTTLSDYDPGPLVTGRSFRGREDPSRRGTVRVVSRHRLVWFSDV